MNRIPAYSIVFVLLVYAVCWPTIINIPADYPTIQQGIDASADGDTVLVQPGTYYENVSFNGHGIVLSSLFLTTGDTMYIHTTVICGETYNDSAGVKFIDHENNSAILTGFTITGWDWGVLCRYSHPIIVQNRIINNIDSTSNGSAEGGGIKCENAGPVIKSNYIAYNGAYATDGGAHGGGIICDNSGGVITLNIIEFNGAISVSTRPNYTRAYGIYGEDFALIIKNNVVRNVYSSASFFNTACGICVGSNARIINNIVLDVLGGPTMDDEGFGISGGREIVNCIVRNNKENVSIWHPDVRYSNIQRGHPGIGNIDEEPYFRDPGFRDFRLRSPDCGFSHTSPCIDTGEPAMLDSMLDCSWGLGGMRSDMGAYGGGDTLITAIIDDYTPTPGRFILMQNHPNPFNAQTSISFVLPEPQEVQLDIYDLLGRPVQKPVDEFRQAGSHTVTVDASDLSSGIYFYRLQAGQMIETRRMVLLK